MEYILSQLTESLKSSTCQHYTLTSHLLRSSSLLRNLPHMMNHYPVSSTFHSHKLRKYLVMTGLWLYYICLHHTN